jgi:hypothetical protein
MYDEEVDARCWPRSGGWLMAVAGRLRPVGPDGRANRLYRRARFGHEPSSWRAYGGPVTATVNHLVTTTLLGAGPCRDLALGAAATFGVLRG